MTAAERWLRERVPGAPADLLEAMIAALPGDIPEVAEALAGGAMGQYARVATGRGGREDALPLLVADALLTHAFAAQAEHDPARLEEFAARWGARGALAEVGA